MRLLVVSPHFDDAPLSLGQSMLDGALSRHDVTVGVVFARSSWVRFFHPTRRRRILATGIRRAEEAVAARRFGYRVVVGDREEAVLRLDTTQTAEYLDPSFDVAASGELDSVVRTVTGWASTHDVVLVPLGIGDHIDHQLAAAAGLVLAAAGVAVGFYVDRPYGSLLSDEQHDEAAARLAMAVERVEVSGPITSAKQRRLWYPSQFDGPFVEALANDHQTGRREAIFAPSALLALGDL